MSTTTAAPVVPTTEVKSEAAPVLKNVGVDDLIVGKTISFPLYDEAGVLLLAAGSVITSDVKKLLRTRKQGSVQIDTRDAANATLSNEDASDWGASIETQLSQELDTIISSSEGLFVSNDGPAAAESMVFHGRKGYDQAQRESLTLQHKSTCESIDNMMRDALSGRRISGSHVTQLAATYLTDLSGDCDQVLTVAQDAAHQDSISQHSLQMSLLGMAIGVEMRLNAENVRTLGIAALVHDWGMVRVPESIRSANRILTTSEFIEIKKHPVYALDLLERVTGMPRFVPLVAYQVHERPNGSGYPRGRTSSTIHPFAKILNVADSYVALTSPRPYRPALMPYAAMELLLKQARKKIVDPDVVRALLHVVSLFPIGSAVVLTDGSIARVIRRNGNNYTAPIVQVIRDAAGNKVPKDDDKYILDLAQGDIKVGQALPTPGKSEVAACDEYLDMDRARALARLH